MMVNIDFYKQNEEDQPTMITFFSAGITGLVSCCLVGSNLYWYKLTSTLQQENMRLSEQTDLSAYYFFRYLNSFENESRLRQLAEVELFELKRNRISLDSNSVTNTSHTQTPQLEFPSADTASSSSNHTSTIPQAPENVRMDIASPFEPSVFSAYELAVKGIIGLSVMIIALVGIALLFRCIN